MATITTAENWFERRPWIDEPNASIDDYIRSAPSLPTDYQLDEQLEHWREHGIVIFEKAVDEQVIDSLLEDVECLVTHPTEYEVTVDPGGGDAHSDQAIINRRVAAAR